MALELVSGADFLCKLMHVDSRWDDRKYLGFSSSLTKPVLEEASTWVSTWPTCKLRFIEPPPCNENKLGLSELTSH